MGRTRLLVTDFVLSFMWAWSGVLIKIFVYKYLGMSRDPLGDIVNTAFVIANMFFFAVLMLITHGAFNPLTILANAISGDFSEFLYFVGARIPTQVLGSIVAVRHIIDTIPEVGRGPRLNIGINHGALTEGFLAYLIVLMSLGLPTKVPGSFLMKTWMSSVSKVALGILASDLTGGIMNPASAMGWAYARGDHITKEHLVVYWLAPVEATVLAVWTFKLLVGPVKEEKSASKSKSE